MARGHNFRTIEGVLSLVLPTQGQDTDATSSALPAASSRSGFVTQARYLGSTLSGQDAIWVRQLRRKLR